MKIRIDKKISKLTIMCLLSCGCSYPMQAKEKTKHVLNNIQKYYDNNIRLLKDTIRANSYLKYTINIDKHNPTIYSIPTVYRLAKSNERIFFGESYWKIFFLDKKRYEAIKQSGSSTIGSSKSALENVYKYLLPNIYNVTIVDDYLLSPFNKYNRKFYIYHNEEVDSTRTKITFRPRTKNTQLVRGHAFVNTGSGKIISYDIDGEYDMTKFKVEAVMEETDSLFLIPVSCSADTKISYLGNRIIVNVMSVYNKETIKSRPIPLTDKEMEIMNRYDSIQELSTIRNDTVITDIKKQAKHILWDVIGDNVINRIRTNFGENDKGYLRLGPIFNPLYFGYSNSKGVVYKLRMNANYNFTDNSDISIYLRLGYSFKLRQLYYNFPLKYSFDRKNNGYIQVDFGNGNRISNSSILDNVKKEYHRDSIDFDKMNLDYFKDMFLKLVCNYDFTERIGIQGGFVFHKRSAVDNAGFVQLDKPATYKTFAPLIQLQYRPWGYKSLILTADYEHGSKNIFGGDISYDRWEFDASYILSLPCTRTLSLKSGLGFYSSKGKEEYFLDYTNFRDNNLPGGWNDEWTGEFELLGSNWYNASDYYFRINTAYESPLMLLAWIPKIGQVIEKERIYISALAVRRLYPYMECGYGFTNRAFSMGIFTGFSNKRYEGFGFKFGFELFDNW